MGGTLRRGHAFPIKVKGHGSIRPSGDLLWRPVDQDTGFPKAEAVLRGELDFENWSMVDNHINHNLFLFSFSFSFSSVSVQFQFQFSFSFSFSFCLNKFDTGPPPFSKISKMKIGPRMVIFSTVGTYLRLVLELIVSE